MFQPLVPKLCLAYELKIYFFQISYFKYKMNDNKQNNKNHQQKSYRLGGKENYFQLKECVDSLEQHINHMNLPINQIIYVLLFSSYFDESLTQINSTRI